MIPYNGIIDPWSTKFVDDLVRTFRSDHNALLVGRRELKNDLRGLKAYVDMPSPAGIKNHIWTVKAPPVDLIDRRVEITGPAVDPKMALNAMLSGASGYMVDGEDSLSPTWENVLRTQSTLTGLSRRSLRVQTSSGELALPQKCPTLHYRPRGLHMFEKNWIVDGRPAPASIVDAGLFMWWNAKELLARGTGPYLYLPKLETEFDARFWNRLLGSIEERLGIEKDSVRVTVLIETVPGLIRAENIVWSLRDRITGLNVGRWDYMLSLVRSMHSDCAYVLPNRDEMVMTAPALEEYARRVVGIAHRRGAHAIGGMAAQVPSRKDPVAAELAIDAVRRDKRREVAMGHDGTWVAHPDLVPVALEVFDCELSGRFEQRWRTISHESFDLSLVTTPIDGARTAEGVRDAARTAIVYLDAWLSGNGCVAMRGKMEDAATAEISRALLWQWVARGAVLDDGTRVDGTYVDYVVRGEAAALAAAGNEPRMETIELLMKSIMVPQLPDHILIDAYDVLINRKIV